MGRPSAQPARRRGFRRDRSIVRGARPAREEPCLGSFFGRRREPTSQIFPGIYEQSGGKRIAVEYVRRIREWCDHLLVFPEAGRMRNDLRPGIRIVTFERRVVIAYKVPPSGDVEIGRLFYGGRDYEAIMRGEDQGGEE